MITEPDELHVITGIVAMQTRQDVYNELHAYYQDLILPGGSISRSELLARLEMLALHPLGG